MASTPSQLRVCSSAASRSSSLMPARPDRPGQHVRVHAVVLAGQERHDLGRQLHPAVVDRCPGHPPRPGRAGRPRPAPAWLRSEVENSYAGMSCSARRLSSASDSAASNSATRSANCAGLMLWASTSSPSSRQTAWFFSSTTNRHGASSTSPTTTTATQRFGSAASRSSRSLLLRRGRRGHEDDLRAPQQRVRVRHPRARHRVGVAPAAGLHLRVGTPGDLVQRVVQLGPVAQPARRQRRQVVTEADHADVRALGPQVRRELGRQRTDDVAGRVGDAAEADDRRSRCPGRPARSNRRRSGRA